MDDELFAELVHAVREGGVILRGEAAPSRLFEVDATEAGRDVVRLEREVCVSAAPKLATRE